MYKFNIRSFNRCVVVAVVVVDDDFSPKILAFRIPLPMQTWLVSALCLGRKENNAEKQ